MNSIQKFFADLPEKIKQLPEKIKQLWEKIKKMTPKQIVCTVMCVLLITVIVLTCIVIGKVSRIFNSMGSTAETTDPTGSSQTTAPTQTTVPTQTTAPTVITDPDHVHEFVLTESVEATCLNYGYNIYTCSCGKQDIPLEEQTVPLGHSYGAGQTVSPTCTENGYTKHTCSRCGDVVTSNTVAATGHDYVLIEEVEGTCGVQGHTISECSLCGDKLTEYVGELLEHTYEIVEEHSASCTEDGYTLYRCTNCGEEHNDNVLPATGHSFSSWSKLANGSWQRTCTNEGCTLKETSADLKIRKDQSGTGHDSSGNPYKLYMIYVGTETAPDLFLYTINDFLDNGTLNYAYDPVQGLIITYTNNSGTQILVQPILQSSEVTIPAETETPVETTPTPTQPETTPVETAPVETTPVETTPVETTPAETTPVETTPVETAPAETTPVETTLPSESGDPTDLSDGSPEEPAAEGITE